MGVQKTKWRHFGQTVEFPKTEFAFSGCLRGDLRTPALFGAACRSKTAAGDRADRARTNEKKGIEVYVGI